MGVGGGVGGGVEGLINKQNQDQENIFNNQPKQNQKKYTHRETSGKCKLGHKK